jgi:hypothetical protein
MGVHGTARIALDVKFNMTPRLPDENPEKLSRLNSVASLLNELCRQSSADEGLDRVIAAYEAVVKLTPDGHQYQAELFSQLGFSLLRRYLHSGNLVDIENAIFALEDCLLLTPDGHAKVGGLNNLGICFLHYFERSGDLVDIE